MMSKRYDEADYEILDRFLGTAFQLLEGFADVKEARATLDSYLQYHRQHQLPPEMEEMLLKLFQEKCQKEGT